VGFAKKHDRSGAFCRRFFAAREPSRVVEGQAKHEREHKDVQAPTAPERVSDAEFSTRSESLKKEMQKAYLTASPKFLRLLQANVIQEWREEDPEFCRALEDVAKRARGLVAKDVVDLRAGVDVELGQVLAGLVERSTNTHGDSNLIEQPSCFPLDQNMSDLFSGVSLVGEQAAHFCTTATAPGAAAKHQASPSHSSGKKRWRQKPSE